jgi:hypothetical protein
MRYSDSNAYTDKEILGCDTAIATHTRIKRPNIRYSDVRIYADNDISSKQTSLIQRYQSVNG